MHDYYYMCISGISTTTPSAVEEHRRLFSYSAGIRSTSFSPHPAHKEPHQVGKANPKKIQTCTIKFLCLNKVSSKTPPTQIVEKVALANSDLGPGTIVFDADGNSSHFHQTSFQD